MIITDGSRVDVFPGAAFDAEDIQMAVVIASDRADTDDRTSDSPVGQFQYVPAIGYLRPMP
jgi:hypothetical protein